MSLQIDFNIGYAGSQCLYREIYQRFREAIVNGSLPAGVRVPSIRTLASELRLSRNTVEKAYDLLIGEGLLVSNGSAGTTVAPVSRVRPAIRSCRVSQPEGAADRVPQTDLRRTAVVGRVEPEDMSQLSVLAGHLAANVPRPFQLGIPALDAFPVGTWLTLSQRVLRDRLTLRQEGDPQGYLPLRQAIAAHVHLSRGIHCLASQVFVTQGYRQSLSLVAAALLRPGDEAWVEDPVYPPALRLLQRLGIRPVAVPVDEAGIQVEVGRSIGTGARLALVTPANQSPLGMAMSIARRSELLAWAVESEAWILEDDYDSEFCAEGRLQPTLCSLDREGRAIYFGSFSKALHPTLRVSYIVVSASLVPLLRETCRDVVDGAPIPIQRALATFMVEGHFGRHLKRMRGLYNRRREVLVRQVEKQLGDRLRCAPAGSGLCVLAKLHDCASDTAIAARAEAVGLAVGALSARGVARSPGQGLLLGHSNFVDETAVKRAVELLVGCM